MMRLVMDVNGMRRAEAALRGSGASTCFTHESREAGQCVVAWKRSAPGSVVLAVINASNRQWTACDYGLLADEPPGTTFHELLNSQADIYGGWEGSGNAFREIPVEADGTLRINLPKWSVLYFRRDEPGTEIPVLPSADPDRKLVNVEIPSPYAPPPDYVPPGSSPSSQTSTPAASPAPRAGTAAAAAQRSPAPRPAPRRRPLGRQASCAAPVSAWTG
eukprot:tig00000402_g228.t1